jgi:hypothetical protein
VKVAISVTQNQFYLMEVAIMKRVMVLVVMLVAVMFVFPAVGMAQDQVLKGKIETAIVALDKNGNQYVRLIVNETRKLQGVSYEVGTAVMAFGSTVTQAKKMKAGDKLSAIVSSRIYQGRKSYTVLAFTK